MEYELYHHGILGMHWGIRRYQNKDGSLTAAGKKRYQDSTVKEKEPVVTTYQEHVKKIDTEMVKNATGNFYANQSNKNKVDYSIDVNDSSGTGRAQQLVDRFMDGKFNKAIYSKILNETYDTYLDWCKQGDIKPQDRLEFIKGIRKAGFNSGGAWYSPMYKEAVLSLYVNDNDTFWGHVFDIEIGDVSGVMKRKVGLDG